MTSRKPNIRIRIILILITVSLNIYKQIQKIPKCDLFCQILLLFFGPVVLISNAYYALCVSAKRVVML